jgi:hypothetical protein
MPPPGCGRPLGRRTSSPPSTRSPPDGAASPGSRGGAARSPTSTSVLPRSAPSTYPSPSSRRTGPRQQGFQWVPLGTFRCPSRWQPRWPWRLGSRPRAARRAERGVRVRISLTLGLPPDLPRQPTWSPGLPASPGRDAGQRRVRRPPPSPRVPAWVPQDQVAHTLREDGQLPILEPGGMRSPDTAATFILSSSRKLVTTHLKGSSWQP